VPSLNNEKRLWAQGLLRVVGVDEVGMAALAGPVVAAACMVTPDTKLIRKVNDSKVLTRLQREGLLDSIRGRVVKVGIGEATGASAAALETAERESRRAAAAQSVHADGFVKDLVNMFDGKVVDSTIREERK